jgi:hypothetical protein
MSVRTIIVLFLGMINALFLCWYFIMMSMYGSVLICEPIRPLAIGEVIFTLLIAGLSIERLINIKERR